MKGLKTGGVKRGVIGDHIGIMDGVSRSKDQAIGRIGITGGTDRA